MNCCLTVFVALAFQINGHTSVAVYALMFMIDFLNSILHFDFLCIIVRFPMLSVIVISVWIDIQPA